MCIVRTCLCLVTLGEPLDVRELARLHGPVHGRIDEEVSGLLSQRGRSMAKHDRGDQPPGGGKRLCIDPARALGLRVHSLTLAGSAVDD